jgi:hypothetical protein
VPKFMRFTCRSWRESGAEVHAILQLASLQKIISKILKYCVNAPNI